MNKVEPINIPYAPEQFKKLRELHGVPEYYSDEHAWKLITRNVLGDCVSVEISDVSLLEKKSTYLQLVTEDADDE